MNDLDVLTRRLDELGRNAPVPETDLTLDIRRGRAALLRRRRARNAAAVTTTVLAVGAAVVAAPLLGGPGRDGAGQAAFQPAASPSASADQAASLLCSREWAMTSIDRRQALSQVRGRHDDGVVGHLYGPGMLPKPWKDPVIEPVLDSYRQAAAEILDPSGQHLDRKVTNVQSGCGEDRLTSLGTMIGWRSGDALGVVQMEVVAAPRKETAIPHKEAIATSEVLVPQIVMGHDQWAAYDGALPAGVRKARVVDDGDGHAVVVKRDDGLTVAVEAAGVWGNNAAPGSSAASDLPPVEKLLALAASPLLTLP